MIAASDENAKPTLRQRTTVALRRLSNLWLVFIALLSIGYVLYEYAGVFSLTAARVWTILLTVAFCGTMVWFRKTRASKCEACNCVHTDRMWNYCPGCSVPTDLVFDDANRAAYTKKAKTLLNAYVHDTQEITTRRRAVRWSYAQWMSLLIFVVGVFGVMPFYFVGPWTTQLAARWYWIMFGSMLPFFLVRLISKIKGLRCVNCAHTFNPEHYAIRFASTTRSEPRWQYCPHCAHPLDAPSSINR
jgi:hypothetical protein